MSTRVFNFFHSVASIDFNDSFKQLFEDGDGVWLGCIYDLLLLKTNKVVTATWASSIKLARRFSICQTYIILRKRTFVVHMITFTLQELRSVSP